MLRVAITKLYGPVGSGANGEILGEPQQFTDCQVEIPYANDARTARVTVSAYDEVAAHVRPLDRMLKVWYRFVDSAGQVATRLVFWGPITVPEWDMQAGTVTVNAHDPSLRLRHSYINHSDTAILAPGGTGGTQAKGVVTTDGAGMRLLLDSGAEDSDFPTLGIIYGFNTTPTAPLLTDGFLRSMTVVRGDESFQSMVNLSQDLYSPDFEFEPWDGTGDYPGASGTVAATGLPASIPSATTTEVPVFVDIRHNVSKMRMSFYLPFVDTAELRVSLRHPDGTEVLISDFGHTFGVWGADCDHRLFVDDDVLDFGWDTPGASSHGSVHGDEPFSKLRGKPAYGTWTVLFEASFAGGAGTIDCLSLLFEGRGNRVPGQYARMHTWQKDDNDAAASPAVWSEARLRLKGPPDKTATVVFQHGFGADNVDELTYSPGGDRVINYYVAVTESKDDDRPTHRQISQNFSSRVAYGTYMAWQAVGSDAARQSTSPGDFLKAVANESVSAYGDPPQFVTFTPSPDPAGGSYAYGRDFWPGDTVTLAVKRGALALRLQVFIQKVTLTQLDAADNVRAVVEAVPSRPLLSSDTADAP